MKNEFIYILPPYLFNYHLLKSFINIPDQIIPKGINTIKNIPLNMPYEIEEIKKIRKNLGLTQFDLAKRSNVSQSMIAKIEAGRLDPSYSNARKIFTALDDLSKKEELKAIDIMNKKIISVLPDDDIKKAIQKMKKHQISQMPVIEGNTVVGIVSESIVLDSIMEKDKDTVKDIMKESPPIISHNTSSEVITNLLKFYPMVLVSKEGKLVGLISKSDLIGKMYK